ncbi:hypothetical protein [Natranaeroarchaeum aerophilus]|uniref:Uncharacterized protein n=1 Tax=Natranaeroarchaeum aerophilus TaxID=2917711 RepID=A0AAE3FPZ8_9EURY|nr:hypothetical protein [Natranaeroarchaeum aerophilus]MCL9813218.1 hypothetical protein [Natranaeroarchaeum aerophilus]
MSGDARFKPVPPAPDSLDRLHEARQAVPLVPGDSDDCCARVARNLALDNRQQGETWLVFLRALSLVEAGDRGYHRTREDVETAELGARFRDRVVGADDVLSAVEDADEPQGVDRIFERVRETVPSWERRRHDNWESVWRERTARLLGWAVLFEL